MLYNELQAMHVDVTLNNGKQFIATFVYASNDGNLQRRLWNKIFLTILYYSKASDPFRRLQLHYEFTKRVQGSMIRPFHFADLMHCVNDSTDLKYKDNYLTWTNKQEDIILLAAQGGAGDASASAPDSERPPISVLPILRSLQHCIIS